MTLREKIRFRNYTLKTRTAISVTLLFILFSSIVGALGLSYFEDKLKESILAQQLSLVTSIAEHTDEKFFLIHNSLIAQTRSLTAEIVADPQKAQAFLDSQFNLQVLFNNALFLFSPEGRLIAESPFIAGRRGRDISFRDYFRTTMATGKSLISAPYVSTHNPGHPAIILTAPVRDMNGRIIAILSGSLDLLGKNFLGEVSQAKIGKSGYLFFFTPGRTMIMHPDRTRIMKQDIPPGANRLLDRAVEGFEGSGVTVNSRGLHVLTSFKRLKSTGWIVGGNIPVSEAYAPIWEARRFLISILIAVTAMIVLAVWLLMRRYMAPLEEVTRHVESLPDIFGPHRLLPVNSRDEIGTLAGAFNGLMAQIDRHQQNLRESEINFRAIAENASDGFLIIGSRGRYVYANRRASLITGYPQKELVGLRVPALVPLEELAILRAKYRRSISPENSSFAFETTLLTRDGLTVPVEITTARTLWLGKRGELVIIRDISSRKQAEQEIRQLAYFDTLTGLPNRTLLHDRLGQAVAHAVRDGRHVGVMFLDLDRFKAINDTLGHVAGDLLLKEVAVRLIGCIRETDTVARLGGDEFVIVLPAISHDEDVSRVAEKILGCISLPARLEGEEIYTSASIGIALFPADGDEIHSLLKHADIAMYQAKEQGRNNYQFYLREMNERAAELLMLESSLRRAIIREEFFLTYQPQMDLASGRVIGVEALLRWQHPELGLLLPGRFISMAEETGLINPIGEWVLRSACRQAKKWQEAGLPTVRLAVNISARQFAQHNFAEIVAAIVAESGLSPEWLELELTESALMRDARRTETILKELKRTGITISIDDFGTGYSSLSYLKQFPIDRVKIDRSFVHNINEDPNDAAIAEAIIMMAHTMGMGVVAEGIERQEQLSFLAARGCDEMQGYFLSIPLQAEEAGRFIGDGRGTAGQSGKDSSPKERGVTAIIAP